MLGGSSSLSMLPVVELKPFVRRQWLPSKSRPEINLSRSYTSLSGFSSSNQLSFKTTSGFSPRRTNGTEWEAKRPTPQRSISLPPNKWSMKQTNAKESPRFNNTPDDLNSSREFMFPVFNETVTEEFKSIEVQGQRINDGRKDKPNIFHTSHWEYYKSRSEPARSDVKVDIGQDIENLRTRLENLENTYADSIYDTFDRAQTLPSISVQTAPMRRRKARFDRKPSAKVPSKVPYRLGVANSLDVLSHFGQPGRIERQLTYQLKHTMSQLRRTKDNVPGARVVYRIEACPTPGESLMRIPVSSLPKPTVDTTRQLSSRKAKNQAQIESVLDTEPTVPTKLPVMIPPALQYDIEPVSGVNEMGDEEAITPPNPNEEKEEHSKDAEKDWLFKAQLQDDKLSKDEQEVNDTGYESSHSGVG